MPKILVVDDSPTSLEWLSYYLELIGHHKVAQARSGKDAKIWILRHRFEVLVFDYTVADVNGLDMLRWTRGHKILTPCIIISAMDEYKLDDIGKLAKAEGLDPVQVLPKTREPPSVILHEINNILDMAKGVSKHGEG